MEDNQTMDAATQTSSTNSSDPLSEFTEMCIIDEEGLPKCGFCSKVFQKQSQLRLHVNIHYFDRPFRCDACLEVF